MLKSEDKAAVESLLCICQKMVDCLVQKVLTHDENVKGEKMDLVSCAKTLHLFCSLRPSLLLSHVSTLHHYLGSTTDVSILKYLYCCLLSYKRFIFKELKFRGLLILWNFLFEDGGSNDHTPRPYIR